MERPARRLTLHAVISPPDAPEASSGAGHESAWYAQREALYSGGNEVTLLTGGGQVFPAMHAAIARARHEVWLATYIFHDDAASRAMADALREHFSRHGATPLYVVIGRGGPNLVRGMGALRDTCVYSIIASEWLAVKAHLSAAVDRA